MNGFRTELRNYPEIDVVIAILVNTGEGTHPNDIANAIADRIFGAQVIPTAELLVNPRLLVGSYHGWGTGREVVVNVTTSEGRLLASVDGGPTSMLQHLGSLRFTDNQTFGAWPPAVYFFELQGERVQRLQRDAGLVSSWLTRRD